MTQLRKRISPDDDHLFVKPEDDYYVEPQWVSRRLFEVEQFEPWAMIYDPACGSGNILMAAHAAKYHAIGADIFKRTPLCDRVEDFTKTEVRGAQAIVCNPPFSLVEPFMELALRIATKVAFFVPLKFLFGDERSRKLEATPLQTVWLLTPRPSCTIGAAYDAGVSAGSGTEDFCWAIWRSGYGGRPEIRWLHRDG